jgi:hypothetical protein
MTETEFEKTMDAMLAAQCRALGLDPDDPHGIEPTPEQKEIIHNRFTAEMDAKLKNDQEFKEALAMREVKKVYKQMMAERLPSGEYREDGLLPLSAKEIVEMPWATREHLLAWALLEGNDANLAYIKSRLDLWDAHPECQKLEELEAVIR